MLDKFQLIAPATHSMPDQRSQYSSLPLTDDIVVRDSHSKTGGNVLLSAGNHTANAADFIEGSRMSATQNMQELYYEHGRQL